MQERNGQPQAQPTPAQPEPARTQLPQPLLDLITRIEQSLRQ